MNRAAIPALVLPFALLFASCVQPVRISTRDEAFLARDLGRKPWRNVAVLPFNGPPESRRVAAEWLAFRVRGLGLFEVTDPSLAEIELKRNGFAIGEADVTVDDACRAGLALGVDGVVFGSTTHTSPPGVPAPPTANATVLDTSTGKVVATSTQSKIVWNADYRELLVAAVDAVAEDLAPVFHALAGKPWSPPPKEEIERPGPPQDAR